MVCHSTKLPPVTVQSTFSPPLQDSQVRNIRRNVCLDRGDTNSEYVKAVACNGQESQVWMFGKS